MLGNPHTESMKLSSLLQFLMILTLQRSVMCADLEDVIESVRKLINYYQSSYKNMNLDGIYGLRLLEGQLKILLDNKAVLNLRNHPQRRALEQRLHNMYMTAGNVSRSSLNYIKRDDPEYYERMRPLVDRPFVFSKRFKKLDLTLEWPPDTRPDDIEGFNEEFSDGCMKQIMGDGEDPETLCAISEDCLRVMLMKGMEEYFITHQLLYMMIAEKYNCIDRLESFLADEGFSPDIENTQLEFCSNNFIEVQNMVLKMNGVIHPLYQDLFMEQEFVCPLLGYVEFLHSDWLDQIISWQSPAGCYGQKQFGSKDSVKHDLQRAVNAAEKGDISAFKAAGVHIQDDKGNVVIQQNDELIVHRVNLSARSAKIPPRQPQYKKNNNIQLNDPKLQVAGNRIVRRDAGLEDHWQQQVPQRQQIPNPPLNNLPLQNSFQNRIPPLADSADSAGRVARPGKPNIAALPVRANPPLNRLPNDGPNDKWARPPYQSRYQERGDQYVQQRPFQKRRLLFEKDLPDGCMSHMSAVAAGALSQYLRFMLMPSDDPDLQPDTIFNGPNLLMIAKQNDFVRGPRLKPRLRFVDDENGDSQLLHRGLGIPVKKGQGKLPKEKPRHLGLAANPYNAGVVEEEEDEKDEEGEGKDNKDEYFDKEGAADGDIDDLDANGNYVFQPLKHGARGGGGGRLGPDGEDRRDAYYSEEEEEDEEAEEDEEDEGVDDDLEEDEEVEEVDKPNARDEEYEQYIDNDEEKEGALGAGGHPKFGQARMRKIDKDIFQQHVEEVNDDQDAYNYYDNNNKDSKDPHKDTSIIEEQQVKLEYVKSKQFLDNPRLNADPSLSGSLGWTYMFIVGGMVILLFLMYRFVRKRRILIRYR